MNLTIIPVTKEKLKETIRMLKKIFPIQDEEENVETCFKASLNYQKYEKILKEWKIPKLEYFVAIDFDTQKVIGSTGIYEMVGEPLSAWIGWTGVHKDYRRQGIGEKLIKYSITLAKKRGYAQMKLHTVDIDSQKNAHKLYEKLGFKLIKIEKNREIGHDRLYYELKL